MNIKKSIVGSLFSMLLVSEMAAADWGDVYYCQMTNFNEIMLDGEEKSWKLEKFQFKLDQTKNAMVFGSTGVFTNQVYKLNKGKNWLSQEAWYANDEYTSTYFENGKLLVAQNGSLAAVVISADCEKF